MVESSLQVDTVDQNQIILYDRAQIASLPPALFSPDYLQQLEYLTTTVQGRGTAWFFYYENADYILRHYRRGGMIGRFLHDRYFGKNSSKSRPFQEFSLLLTMHRSGLPVPEPVGARLQQEGWFYRADLITKMIPDSVDLADYLSSQAMALEDWQRLGYVIAQFHHEGIYHADLNAKNILLDADKKFYVIDFDKGCFRKAGRWKTSNLKRLQRSLMKFLARNEAFHFDSQAWQAFNKGYLAN